ncbi:MAG: DUF2809 domain-containing protein [Acidobacteria bacterium]|jgi:hypothetical protein|nr:DUF2809 domain-containing protein [Bryobacteraceae bacterium CoA2 C42]
MEAARWFWTRRALAIIALGLLSRSVATGWVVIDKYLGDKYLGDKYLGDALYAAMMYAWLRTGLQAGPAAGWAAGVMVAIESFQISGIPARMFGSGNGLARIVARLLGVQFGWADLLAYAVGIGLLWAFDAPRRRGGGDARTD